MQNDAPKWRMKQTTRIAIHQTPLVQLMSVPIEIPDPLNEAAVKVGSLSLVHFFTKVFFSQMPHEVDWLNTQASTGRQAGVS
jgi:hypothetical protein